MAKPRTPNQKKRYASLNKRLGRYVALVQSIYDTLASEAASIVTTGTGYTGEDGVPFRFKDYPATKGRVDELMRHFSHDIQALIYSGTTDEWKRSNLVQDLLANDVLKVYGIRRNGEKVKRYYEPNNDALKAFQQRKDKGMTVSQKVWNQSYNFKRELEYAISSAIEKGQSAVTLSKRISKYLHDFPSLQKDYGERYGKAVECQSCEYRSIRLARSEINMAYRTAEQTRWEQMDFIKGYEIKLSHSHPKRDICDDLIGVYPKWFKWPGWHPNCFCICIPIVMTDDEWYSGKGEEIKDVPNSLLDWIDENQERIAAAEERGTNPYWIRDNKKGLIEQVGYEFTKPQEIHIDIQEHIDSTSSDFEEKIVLANKRRREYYRLLENSEYTDVEFDPDTLGLRATHTSHNKSNPKEEKFFEGLTGKELEVMCQDVLYKTGHSCILLPENLTKDGNYVSCLDAIIDEKVMDIRSITSDSKNFGGAIKDKCKQLFKYNALEETTTKAHSMCMFFYEPSYFSETKIFEGVEKAKRYLGLERLPIDEILCVFRDGTTRLIKIE